jgi:hypothetical protein
MLASAKLYCRYLNKKHLPNACGQEEGGDLLVKFSVVTPTIKITKIIKNTIKCIYTKVYKIKTRPRVSVESVQRNVDIA